MAFKKDTTGGNTDYLIDKLLDSVSPDMQSDIDAKMGLASKIYAGMRAKGWNQSDFAFHAKKRVSVISKWLKGYHNFGVDTLLLIEKVLHIKLLDYSTIKDISKKHYVSFLVKHENEDEFANPENQSLLLGHIDNLRSALSTSATTSSSKMSQALSHGEKY